jgi:hypothetical protein
MKSRLGVAENMARGKRVLDIGGRKMPGNDEKYPRFAAAYQRVRAASKEYRIVDCQADPQVNYVMDLNRAEGVSALDKAINEYQPEVILCMETLEHLNYHYEVMNALARAVRQFNTRVYITLPNNSNWVVNRIIGIHDHSIAFFRDVAWRFVKRSDLGTFNITLFPCTGTYLWYWRLVWALGFFQPTSWGFYISTGEETPPY